MLVVEDDAAIRRLTRRVVERECGYRVIGEASDGAEGVRLAEELAPDVVLLDLGMPVMDGFEALPLLRRVSPTSRIVIHSARPPSEAAARTLGMGAFEYVEKDPSSRALVAALCRAMHRAVEGDACGCAHCGSVPAAG